jgi:hypothetical protein
MMKRTAILSLALFALAACSGSTTTNSSSTGGSGSTSATSGSGSSSSSGGSSSVAGCGPETFDGGLNVELVSVGVHPAALAALTAVGLTPPPLAGNYTVILQAVTLKAGNPSTTTVGEIPLTSANATGPVTFDNVSFAGGIASLGVISAVNANPLPDGGFPPEPAWPTCAQVTPGASGTAPGGFTDFYVPAGGQVYFGTPTADICSGTAFALPASYVAILDCAAGLTPGSAGDLLGGGFSLLYASQSAAAGGSPLAGVTFSNGSGSFLYYPTGYAAGAATVNGPTSATGIATITGITGLGTVQASDPSAGTFKSRDLATPAGDAYMVFYAPGT